MRRRFTILGVLAVLCLAVSCSSMNAPDVVTLTGAEKQESQAIAEQRQAVTINRQKAAVAYQAQIDRLNEQEQELNTRALELCFMLKKTHKLDMNAGYQLNEATGELLKVGGHR